MRRTDHLFGTITATCPRLAWPAAVLALAAGCSTVPRPPAPPLVSATPAPAAAAEADAVDARRGEFTMAASMLDTWNAAGQLLVRMDGVSYEGRSQMLGIYVVRYRGERFLIVTRALVLRAPARGMLTKVGAVLKNGKPSSSAPAVELLGLLQRRLPAELALIAAGGK